MEKIPCSFLCAFFILGILLQGGLAASVEYDAKIPRLAFAAQGLEDALKVSGPRMLFNLETDPGGFHNITPSNPQLAASLWWDLDGYLTSVDAWRPRGNAAACRADGGRQFEADDNAGNRDTFPPFEGSRKPTGELNDGPKE